MFIRQTANGELIQLTSIKNLYPLVLDQLEKDVANWVEGHFIPFRLI